MWRYLHKYQPNTFLTCLGAALCDVVLGFVFMFGPRRWTSAMSYTVIRSVMPTWVAGAWMMLVGLMILTAGMTLKGYLFTWAWLAGAVIMSIYAFSLLSAAIVGDLQSTPIAALFLALFHFACASEQWVWRRPRGGMR